MWMWNIPTEILNKYSIVLVPFLFPLYWVNIFDNPLQVPQTLGPEFRSFYNRIQFELGPFIIQYNSSYVILQNDNITIITILLQYENNTITRVRSFYNPIQCELSPFTKQFNSSWVLFKNTIQLELRPFTIFLKYNKTNTSLFAGMSWCSGSLKWSPITSWMAFPCCMEWSMNRVKHFLESLPTLNTRFVRGFLNLTFHFSKKLNLWKKNDFSLPILSKWNIRDREKSCYSPFRIMPVSACM